MEAEWRAHLDAHVDALVAGGMSPADAQRRARRDFGDPLRWKEQALEVRGVGWVHDLGADVQYGFRQLHRAPVFAATVSLTLALGIGTATAVFGVVNAVLVRPLPGTDADRLVQIVENIPAAESFRGVPMRTSGMTEEAFSWWRTHLKTLQLAAMAPETRAVVMREETIRLSGLGVSAEWFHIHGVQPLRGRWFSQNDEQQDAKVVLVSEGMWRRYFSADPNILERLLVMDGEPFSIVGVMPGDPDGVDFWRPYATRPYRPGQTTFVGVQSRLRNGVSIDAATTEVNILGHRLRGMDSVPTSPKRFEVVRARDQMVARVRPALQVLAVAALALLLIVCANVANLLLARGTARESEIAVRRALGASRGRIVRQLLTEGGLLAGIGGFGGAVVAIGGMALVKPLATYGLPERFRAALGPAVLDGNAVVPRMREVTFDATAFAFVLSIAVATALLFGLVPALRLSRVEWLQTPRRAFGVERSSRHGTRLRQALAVSQVALATTLLVVTGLLGHSFLKLSSVDLGFDPHVLTFELVAPDTYPASQRLTRAREFADALDALPTVMAVGFVDRPPLSRMGASWSGPVVPIEMEWRNLDEDDRTMIRSGSRDYLRALGLPLIAGSWLDDREGSPPGLLVNRAYARRFFGEKSPLGATLRWGTVGTYQVVGVVEDMHWSVPAAPDERPVPFVFMTARPAGEAPAPSFAVQVSANPLSIVPELRAILRRIDPALVVDGITTLDDVFARLHTRPRFYAVLLGIFGSIAGVIAGIGIYGVLAYTIAQRTREIGIRVALGAQRSQVVRLVARQAAGFLLIGIGAGVGGAIGATRYLEGMLFGLSRLDAATYGVVVAAVAVIGTVASYVPTRRALNVDPMMALRAE